MNRSILAIDYGTKRLGLAYFCDRDRIPMPLQTLINRGHQKLVDELLSIIREKEVDILVIGVPLNNKLKSTPMSEKIRRFAQLLLSKAKEAKLFKINIVEVNEEFSTDEAIDEFQKISKKNRSQLNDIKDELAALIILKRYLNMY